MLSTGRGAKLALYIQSAVRPQVGWAFCFSSDPGSKWSLSAAQLIHVFHLKIIMCLRLDTLFLIAKLMNTQQLGNQERKKKNKQFTKRFNDIVCS